MVLQTDYNTESKFNVVILNTIQVRLQNINQSYTTLSMTNLSMITVCDESNSPSLGLKTSYMLLL